MRRDAASVETFHAPRDAVRIGILRPARRSRAVHCGSVAPCGFIGAEGQGSGGRSPRSRASGDGLLGSAGEISLKSAQDFLALCVDAPELASLIPLHKSDQR